jgi:hypothetical protein
MRELGGSGSYPVNTRGRGEQIPDAMVQWLLYYVRWRSIFVRRQYGICVLSTVWSLQFSSISYVLGEVVCPWPGPFSRGKGGRGAKLISNLYLVLKLRMCLAVTCASPCIFMWCFIKPRITLHFYRVCSWNSWLTAAINRVNKLQFNFNENSLRHLVLRRFLFFFSSSLFLFFFSFTWQILQMFRKSSSLWRKRVWCGRNTHFQHSGSFSCTSTLLKLHSASLFSIQCVVTSGFVINTLVK